MTYAIIADIHGNLPAFKAVLAEAGALGADMYLLLGDYTTCFPWGNEVASTIRELSQAAVIRGNGEGVFISYANGQFDLNNEQYKPAYWDYQSQSRENLEYLMALPETAVVPGLDYDIYLSHAHDITRHAQAAAYFNARAFRIMMETAPITHEEYLVSAREALLACPEALLDIQSLPKGVHLFGHNHMQFHMEYKERLLVNPGSCGQALDFDTAAAYTLLVREDNRWTVRERRVAYDLNEVIEGLHASGFADCSPMWSKIFTLELMTGKVYMTPFVMHLLETGRALGRSEYPVSDEVWHAAVRTWDSSKP